MKTPISSYSSKDLNRDNLVTGLLKKCNLPCTHALFMNEETCLY